MKDYTGSQIERYQVIAYQGMGGMAVVYHAYDTRLERDVALKLIRADAIPAEQHTRMMSRFEVEAKAQSRFSHQNIVPIYDYGEVDGSPFLVMAYLSGGTLKDKISQPVPIKKALAWAIPIADALRYAHRFGVVHRDVKPSNILLTSNDYPVLTDFGIAKLLETDAATLTETNVGVGTPEYMAPEQWIGKTSESCDQYALGVVLYEMLTAARPYTGNTPVAVALKQKRDQFEMPSNLVATIPQPIDELLIKVLSYHPADRFENMTAFHRELQTLQEMMEDPEFKKQNKRRSARKIKVKKNLANKSAGNGDLKKSYLVKKHKQQDKLEIRHNKEAFSKPRRKRTIVSVIAGGLLIVIISLLLMARLSQGNQFTVNLPSTSQVVALDAVSQASKSTEIPTQSPSETPTLQDTPTPTLIPSETSTLTPSPTEEEMITTRFREIDGMEIAFVPAGEFIFGTGKDGYTIYPVYVPFSTHNVYIDGFWVDKYEVTNQQFAQCVEAGACNPPYSILSRTRMDYYSNEDYLDFPVVWVDRAMAIRYCEWVGGRLPTEAEWEKAARGTDGREYPWGNVFTTGDLGNINGFSEDTTPVGSFPEGASPYGALDMYGNVWEWVSDWYHPTIYATEPPDNPTGPIDERGVFPWIEQFH